MNAQRLVRQLKREIKANPKRAMLLGGLVAVGIYFWAPLVAGWVMPKDSGKTLAKSSTKSKSKTGTPNQATDANPGQTTPDQKPKDNTAWTQLWAAIQNDNRTKPSPTLAIATNPFRPFPKLEEPEAHESEDGEGGESTGKKGETAKRAIAPVEITPKTLGMKLTGTAIGPKQRAAVIDGKTVIVGAMVTGGDSQGKDSPSSAAAKATFRLVKVEHESIVLERDAKEYTLVIEKSEDDGIEFNVVPQDGTL